VTSIHFFIR